MDDLEGGWERWPDFPCRMCQRGTPAPISGFPHLLGDGISPKSLPVENPGKPGRSGKLASTSERTRHLAGNERPPLESFWLSSRAAPSENPLDACGELFHTRGWVLPLLCSGPTVRRCPSSMDGGEFFTATFRWTHPWGSSSLCRFRFLPFDGSAAEAKHLVRGTSEAEVYAKQRFMLLGACIPYLGQIHCDV